MALFAVFLLVIPFIDAASKLDVSWSFCTGDDAKECPNGVYSDTSNVTYSPNPPLVGQNFSIFGHGVALEEMTSPSYYMHVEQGFFVNARIMQNGCGPYTYNFPLGLGILYFEGVECPVQKNSNITIPLKAWVNPLAPSGTTTTTLKLYDKPNQEGNCVSCTVTLMKIS